METSKAISALRLVAREQYVWPGGYLLVLVTDDGGLLCADCVRKNYRQIYRDGIDGSLGTGWAPADYSYGTGHAKCDPVEEYESACDHCGAILGELCR